MTNADKFKSIFGLYATELWAKPEKEFLAWLNADAELFGISEQLDTISRQAAIDVAFDIFPDDEYFREQFVKGIEALPSAQPTDRETHAFSDGFAAGYKRGYERGKEGERGWMT